MYKPPAMHSKLTEMNENMDSFFRKVIIMENLFCTFAA